ncbi:MAG: hypothetical protein GY765_17850, partial [bacterium]|nr:hypothetical protein [bacterium]
MIKQKALRTDKYTLLSLIFAFFLWCPVTASTGDFHLTALELSFTDGKTYRVMEQNSLGPAYCMTVLATGRGTLTGQWLLDGQVIGLFEISLREERVFKLKGGRVPRLPTVSPGLHELTIGFSNYEFGKALPLIRYYVVPGGLIETLFPETGAKITVSNNAPIPLQWKWKRRKKYAGTQFQYQVFVTDIPPEFLSEEFGAELWQ